MEKYVNKSSFKLYMREIKKKKKCKLCKEYKNFDRVQELNCEHIICKKCLKVWFKTRLEGNKILVCPSTSCKEKIEKNLSNDLCAEFGLEKYHSSPKASKSFVLEKNEEYGKN